MYRFIKVLGNKGCGIKLNKGKEAYNLWGLLVCKNCEKKLYKPMLAIYSGGILKTDEEVKT